MSDITRFRLHRSITFWTGIAIMLCFSLAWWHSWREVVALRHGSLTVMHASGGLTITRNPVDEKPLAFQRMAPSETAREIRSSFFPLPYSLAGQDLVASGLKVQPRTLEQWHRSWIAPYPRNVSLTFVPDWLVAVALLLPWAGLVTWRIRRRVEAEPAAWIAAEREQAEAPRATPVPPPAPRRAPAEARSGGINWANVVPRGIPGSPWNYAGPLPLTDTPMPLQKER